MLNACTFINSTYMESREELAYPLKLKSAPPKIKRISQRREIKQNWRWRRFSNSRCQHQYELRLGIDRGKPSSKEGGVRKTNQIFLVHSR